MQVLLINQNATIERLVKLSSGKLGYELTNAKDISEVENGAYSFVIMDSDLYNDEEFGILKQKFGDAKYILIITKGADRPDGFDVYVEKPFLPTELVDIFASLAASVDNAVEEEAVFGDEVASFEEEGAISDTLDSLDEDSIFGATEEESSNELGDLDDFASLDLDDEKPMEALDKEDELEFSFDEDTAMDIEPKEEKIDEIALDDTKLDDDFEINLDEQMSAINEEAEGIDFDMPQDMSLSLDESEHEISIPEMDELGDELGALDGLEENDADMELDDISLEEEISTASDDTLEQELSLDDEMGNFDEIASEEMPSFEDDPHIFDEDEVNKLKNLLDETEEEKLESDDDIDLDNIKIHNEELGSLTEESLAEALGVSIDSSSQHQDNNDSGIEDEGDIPSTLPTSTETTVASPSFGLSALQLNPNQSITVSLDALKELLNMADITINITLSKKQ
jgi:uncharacterized membrane protein